MNKENPRVILGLTEEIIIFWNKGQGKFNRQIAVRIDSGATSSSIDSQLAKDLNLGPVIRTRLIKSASGNNVREIILAEVEIKGKIIKEEFSIADRSSLSYPILIGQNILKKGEFLIDPMID